MSINLAADSKKTAIDVIQNGSIGSHDHFVASMYVPGDVRSIASGVFNAIDSTLVSPAISLNRYFGVLTGISNLAQGVQLIKDSKNDGAGRLEGGVKVLRGASEAISGMLQGVVATVKVFGKNASSEALKVVNVVGDAFFCVAMFALSFNCFTKMHNAGSLQNRINRPVDFENPSLIETTNKVGLQALRGYANDTNDTKTLSKIINFHEMVVSKDKSLGKVVDPKLIKEFNDLFEKLGTFNNDEVISELKSKIKEISSNLTYSYRESAVLGALCVISGALVAISDVCTVGVFSQVINILKPIITLLVTYFDVKQLINGLNEAKPESQFYKYMRVALTALSIGIAVAIFVGASGASGGALPAVMLAIGCIMPLISLMISSYPDIKWAFNCCTKAPSNAVHEETVHLTTDLVEAS